MDCYAGESSRSFLLHALLKRDTDVESIESLSELMEPNFCSLRSSRSST